MKAIPGMLMLLCSQCPDGYTPMMGRVNKGGGAALCTVLVVFALVVGFAAFAKPVWDSLKKGGR